MKWVREHCHIIDHPRFLAAGAIGRDLWEWGMKYCGKHETDGEIPMEAVITSPWGAGGKANVKVAAKLVTIGLWERTDLGFRTAKWREMGNPTKAEIEEARREERDGRRARRKKESVHPPSAVVVVSAPDKSECPARTPDGVPNSYSDSLSESRSPEPKQNEIASASGQPPEWFITVLDVLEANVDPNRLPAAEAWLRYDGHRDGKKIAPSVKDAQYWLTTVMIPEQRKAREELARRNASDEKRTAAFVRERHGPEVKPLPSVAPLMRERDEWERTAASPEEQAAAAANLSKLLGKVGT